MDMYPKYKSPFGYETGDNGIDSYGVDHSGFTLRDEIEYQTARDNRESQMMQMYNQQGITDNYPQYTTNFWGSPDNNYGFGSSNISKNIQNVTNRFNNVGSAGGMNGEQGCDSGTMLNYNGYSGYELQLHPNTLSTQGTQYAQILTPSTANDANNSAIINPQDAIFNRVFNRTIG